MLARVPEPELMDDPEEVRAYSEADFSEAHDAFVAHGLACFGPIAGEVLDLGCGAADPTVRFARASPDARIVGVDAAPNMLALARTRVGRAGLDHLIRFECRRCAPFMRASRSATSAGFAVPILARAGAAPAG